MKNISPENAAIKDEDLDLVFHALSDPTRRAIIKRLSQSSGTVTALAEPFDMSLNAVSKHLKTLDQAGLIKREIIGRTSICSLDAGRLADATEWLRQYTEFWTEVLDSFEEHMENKVMKQSASQPNNPDREAG